MQYHYELSNQNNFKKPNIWDLMVLGVIFTILILISMAVAHVNNPFSLGHTTKISLRLSTLPLYALKTVLRMFLALGVSVIVTLIIAPLAAKNKHLERIIIPAVDILQSLPVLGFLSVVSLSIIKLCPNNFVGPELAAIFAIFTAQAWNMILSLYQSLKTVPNDLIEAARIYRLSAWKIFWRVEFPHAIPGLLWNTMVSMSSAWFFIVVAEAFTINNYKIVLPGIGSYIEQAIVEQNLKAIGYAIGMMFIVIILYEEFIFRPLLAWADKFKFRQNDDEDFSYNSWFYDALLRTRFFHSCKNIRGIISDFIDKNIVFTSKLHFKAPINNNIMPYVWYGLCVILLLGCGYSFYIFVHEIISIKEICEVFYLGFITAGKIMILILLASIICVPLGVFLASNAKVASYMTTIIQLLAAFPANCVYPIVVFFVINYKLNPYIWTTPLMILGTQWYILFNVIAGTLAIPKEVRLAIQNFKVTGLLKWRKLIWPAILPYYVTGAMTAVGGCWNASIVAEYVEWGNYQIVTKGIGSYITNNAHIGDVHRVTLGMLVMGIIVIVIDRTIWHTLYNYIERFKI